MSLRNKFVREVAAVHSGPQARCDFEDIVPGTYAFAVIHDENMNGKLDTNSLGVPKEGYGFSNDAKTSLGAPSFSAASLLSDGKKPGYDDQLALLSAWF